MIDTLKILILPEYVENPWDIEEIKSRLQSATRFHRNGFKPLGFIKNMSVSGNTNKLIIEGSIAKYYNKNNVENFNWIYLNKAVKLLSNELGIPLQNGKLIRVDIGINLSLNNSVPEYFDSLIYLENYQRSTRHKNSLRFENNSYRHSFLIYDKLKEFKSNNKLIKDLDLSLLKMLKT